MSGFSVYVDDAERSHTKVSRPTVHGNLQRGIVGKSFNAKKTVSQVGQRKALGEVNRNCNPQDKKASGLKKPAPAKKKQPRQEHTNAKEGVTQRSTTSKVSQLQNNENLEDSYEEIESMHPYDEEKEDDFEDLYPKAERPGTHIKEFYDQRPQSVFSSHHKISADGSEYDPFEEFNSEEEPAREIPDCDVLDEIQLSSSEEFTDNLFAELL